MQGVLRFLDEHHIDYYAYEHAPVYTMRDCAELDKNDDGLHCKNLFLCNRQANQFFLACIPGYKRFVTSEVSRQIAPSRLQFARDEDLFRILGLHPGYVSPFGLLNDKQGLAKLALDEDLLRAERISFHPNTNAATVVLSRADFLAYLDSIGIEPLTFHLRHEEACNE